MLRCWDSDPSEILKEKSFHGVKMLKLRDEKIKGKKVKEKEGILLKYCID